MMYQYNQTSWTRFLPLLLIIIGLPLALEVIPPNDMYGVRISTTLASPTSWYRANFWSGTIAVGFGLAALMINQAVYRAPGLTPSAKSSAFVATFIFVAILMVVAGVVAS